MDNNWLEYIYKNLHRESYIWARQCCSYNDEQAKEVMQLVYLKLLEGKASYKQKATIKTWLFSVIRFTALDYLKKETIHLNIDDLNPIVVEFDYGESIDNYQEVLRKLPTRQYQVLLLVFYHNLTLVEVAEVLGIGIGSVRTHYDRGKKGLRKLLTKEIAL